MHHNFFFFKSSSDKTVKNKIIHWKDWINAKATASTANYTSYNLPSCLVAIYRYKHIRTSSSFCGQAFAFYKRMGLKVTLPILALFVVVLAISSEAGARDLVESSSEQKNGALGALLSIFLLCKHKMFVSSIISRKFLSRFILWL